jgi:hypothetical protein
MSKKNTEDEPFPGLSVHLDAMRLDKAVRERLRDRYRPDAEEQRTDPGVPKAKRAIGAGRCQHGIKPELCDECKRLLEHCGRSSGVNTEPNEDGKKES